MTAFSSNKAGTCATAFSQRAAAPRVPRSIQASMIDCCWGGGRNSKAAERSASMTGRTGRVVLASCPASLDQVVQVLAIVVLKVAVTQQTQQPAAQRQAELRGGGQRCCDRQAEIRYGEARNIGVQQAAGVRM